MNEDIWRFIVGMYGGRCYYCARGGGRLQKEHRIPLARGGTNDISNIVPSCASCNRRKGIMTDDEFFRLLTDEWEYSGVGQSNEGPTRPFPGELTVDGLVVRAPLKRHSRLKFELPPGMKICTACQGVLAESEFGSHRGKKDGLNNQCKKCAAAATRAWRDANPDKKRSRSPKPIESEMSEMADETDTDVYDDES